MTLLSYAFLVLVFTLAPLFFNYFLAVIQRNSTTVFTDVKHWVLFAPFLVLMHTAISQAWHLSRRMELSVWSTSVVATVCGTAGTALALWWFYDEIPGWPKYVGFTLMFIGAIIATMFK